MRSHDGFVSVVVCTAGRRSSLRACLDSLHALDDDAYEIIVVENAPISRIGAGALARWGARHVHEPRGGLDVARNRGVAAARGEIVAFVDDDCVVDPSWLVGFRRAFGDPTIAFVTGRVQALSLERPSERFFDQWFCFDRGELPMRFSSADDRQWLRVLPYALGTGCNMAFRRSVVLAVGGFDVSLDMGTLIGGGGDMDMFARLLRAGVQAAYAPDAGMRHAHRSSTYDLCWQVWGYGLSQGAIASKSLLSPQASVRREALRFLRQRTGMVAGELLRRLRHGRLRSAVLLGIEIAGVLVGPLAYLLSRARTGHLRPDLAPASSPWPVESRVDAATPAMVAHEV